MPHDLGKLNITRAHFLINQLEGLGVTYFCLAPGSRSSALAIAIAESPQVQSFVHFDERGLGFHALGYAKAKGSPAAIVVTSGTAVGNLFPCIMEAYADRIPLLILTADRPPELLDCGANQTTDQIHVFGQHVRWQTSFCLSDRDIPDRYFISTLAQAVYRSMNSPKGPVHINCMIREPSFEKEYNKTLSQEYSCSYEPKISLCNPSSLQKWADIFHTKPKGVILLGSHATKDASGIFTLAAHLGWPVFSDIISGARTFGKDPHHIAYFDQILKTDPNIKLDAVLQFGDRFVSKTLTTFLQRQSNLSYFQVIDHPMRQDPMHLVTHRIECCSDIFCSSFLPFVQKQNSGWIEFWQTNSSLILDTLSSFFAEKEDLLEPYIMHTLSHMSKPWNYFFSNSMPIRDADQFFFPEKNSSQIFANRGVSGIDGNIATVMGISSAINSPLVVVMGDQTFLHDVNSLAQWKSLKAPVIFLVINNGGGGIFSFLPIAEKKQIAEQYFAAAHDLSFCFLAKAFDLPYYSLTTKEEWLTVWNEIEKKPRSILIEIQTVRSENVVNHKEIDALILDTLCSKSKPSAFHTILT